MIYARSTYWQQFALLMVAVLSASQTRANAQDDQAKGDHPRRLPVRCLAFSPDGKSLAVARGETGTAGELAVWDVENRLQKFVLQEDVAVLSVAFSPQGDVVAIGTLSKKAKLFDSVTGELRREVAGHEHYVRSIAFTPDGKQFATGSYDRSIKLWDLATGEVQRIFSGHNSELRVIAISPDGKWLASAGGEESVARLWSLSDTVQPPRQFNLKFFVPQVAFSPDSRQLAISGWGGEVLLIDTGSGDEVGRLTNIGGVNWTTFSPDGKWLAAVSTMGPGPLIFPLPALADENQQREIATLVDQFQSDDYSKREAVSRRLEELISVALPQIRAGLDSPSAEVRVRCRQLARRSQNGQFAIKLANERREWECLAFSPDSKLLASGNLDGAVKLWSVSDWKEAGTLTIGNNAP